MDEPPSYNTLLNIFSDQGLLHFCLTAFFLVLSAWASAVEAAFFTLNSDDINRFGNSLNADEKTVTTLLADSRLLLSSLTTFKYAMLAGAATLFITVFSVTPNSPFNDADVITGVLILTIVFAMFGVIIPKIYGSTHYLTITRKNSRRCQWLMRIFNPVLMPLLRTSIKVERKLDAKTEEKSVEELTQALQLATIDNDPIEGEKEILEGIVNFGTLTVKSVMKPRQEISFADVSLSFHNLMEFVKRSGFSRVPVCRGGLDHVEGVLYIKDLLPYLDEQDRFTWQKLLRPGYFVPETKKIDLLLKDFQEKRVHIALVINAQGHTVGLITLEDIIEEIIGDINDEFDEVGARYQKINDRTFLFDAKTSLQEFCRILHIDPTVFHQVKGINESLGNLLMEFNESLPAMGEQIVIDPFTFIIESIDKNRIKKVRVQIHEAKEK